MDVVENIEAAIAIVEEARSVPLSASCVINRSEMLKLLDQIKASFPNDLAKAIAIQREKESIRKEAARILAEAKTESDRDREEIEEYIYSRLANLEVILNKTLDVISKGRDQLSGVEAKHVLSKLK